MNNEGNGNVKAAIDAVERLAPPVVVHKSELGDLVLVPAGREIVDLKEYLDERREHPERRVGTALLTSLLSFVDHANRFKDAQSAIFADDNPKAPKLIAVLDYHEGSLEVPAPASAKEGDPKLFAWVEGARPRFGKHRGEYAFPVSDQWLAWQRVAANELGQAEFAAFLEDRFGDIVEPPEGGKIPQQAKRSGTLLGSVATMLQLTRGIQIRADVNVVSCVVTASGESHMSFKEEHETADSTGATLKVPQAFVIAIPVFRGASPWALLVRLRYRRINGSVKWRIAIDDAPAAFEQAFREAAKDAAKLTGLPMYFGAPEAS